MAQRQNCPPHSNGQPDTRRRPPHRLRSALRTQTRPCRSSLLRTTRWAPPAPWWHSTARSCTAPGRPSRQGSNAHLGKHSAPRYPRGRTSQPDTAIWSVPRATGSTAPQRTRYTPLRPPDSLTPHNCPLDTASGIELRHHTSTLEDNQKHVGDRHRYNKIQPGMDRNSLGPRPPGTCRWYRAPELSTPPGTDCRACTPP